MGTPERFYRVSSSQLSIARHYGGCKVDGAHYVFDPTTDTLVRADVVKREEGERARKGKEQQGLFEE